MNGKCREWIQSLAWLRNSGQRATSRPVGSSFARRLELEQLEDRRLPSATLPLSAVGVAHPTYQVYQTRGSQPLDVAAPAGLDPAQIRQAYGIDQIAFPGNVAGDGAGQTIAIVDAYDDPTAAGDLAIFDQEFALPDPTFAKVGINAHGQASRTNFPMADADWSIEIALDVEWAHVVAPDADILLVEAASNSYADLLRAVDYARDYSGVSVVSMSWGGSEYAGETAFEGHFTTPSGHTPVTFFASAGDAGAPALFPSVSPAVVSVGGTSLTLDTSGNWQNETGWSGSGGGIGAYFSQPSYQQGLAIYGADAGGRRAAPDVAWDADPSTGLAVLASYGYGGWLQVGGTSAGSPEWAALMAIANQGRALSGKATLDGGTQTLPLLYQLPATDFHDIIAGNNGFPAGPGYDLVTGLGSPIGNFIVPDLIGIAQVPTSMELTPANFTVGDGNQEQFTADILDQFGKPMLTQPTFTWSLVSGAGVIDGNGLYTAPTSGPGADTIEASATVDGTTFSDTVSVRYVPGFEVTSIGAQPNTITGTTATVSATATGPGDGNFFYLWSVQSEPAGAYEPLFADAASTTTVTFYQAGAYTLEVSVFNDLGQTATGTVDVTVVSTLTSIDVSPGFAVVPDGGQQQLVATGYDQFQQPMAATFNWSVNGPGAVDDNGVYSAPASGGGLAVIQASTTVNGVVVSGTAYMQALQPLALTSLTAAADPVTGNATSLNVAVSGPDGDTLMYSWSAVAAPAGAPIPTLDAPGAAGTTATFFHSGAYTFQVVVSDLWGQTVSGTVDVTVASTLTSVRVTPANARVLDGRQDQLTAVALDQFQQPLVTPITWTLTSGPGALDANGLYTAPTAGPGVATVTASATINGATVTGSTNVTLLAPPAILSISASPVTGGATTLAVLASNPGGGALVYAWSVVAEPPGAPRPAFSNMHSRTTKVTFFKPGTYTFRVRVTNQRGQTTIAFVTVVEGVARSAARHDPT
jgi:hypothetical protein